MTWTTLAASLALVVTSLLAHPPSPFVAADSLWAVQAHLPASPLPDVVEHRVIVLRDWVSAVERHTPGDLDSAVVSVSAWSRGDVVSAWNDVQVLVALLKDRNAKAFLRQPAGGMVAFRMFTTREDFIALQDLADGVRGRHFPEEFLKRAALLHSDVAMSLAAADPSATWSSLMSPRRVVVRTEDDQQVSLNGGMVHWEFGIVLLDAIRQPARDEFVRSWYRATLAHKLDVEELDTPHFERARQRLPDDPVIRFQTGCLYEGFAEPRAQAVAQSMRLPTGPVLGILPQRDELRTAEGHFRRALELDPSHAEARLRLGRTLGRLGKHKEAAAELRLATEGMREPLLTYYAQLFLGAEEEALGRFAAAGAAYEQAAALYPLAQAPTLALSQLAHRTGDRVAARNALRAVLESSRVKAKDDDPWWGYRHAAGRHANVLREAMYRSLIDGRQP